MLEEKKTQKAIALSGVGVGLDPMSDEYDPKNPRTGDHSLSESRESLVFTSCVISKKSQTALLDTAILMIADNFGMFHEGRVLLDCGTEQMRVQYDENAHPQQGVIWKFKEEVQALESSSLSYELYGN
ncbi:hypothetical protein NPIL_118181 [Nephila pilipes]|uniref:Uncharacterized protein n=1 Tax=Nephila pilipes TaxID=299642 RepID=A0A8X6QEJ0_NEPPI|nr:hypothetical protein NPIL_118181 [Nephila pilipes]